MGPLLLLHGGIMKRLLLVTTSLILSALILITPNSSSAQGNEEGENITLSPTTSRPELTAGEQYSSKLTVINNGTTDYTFVTYSRPFFVNPDTYEADFEKVTDYTEAYEWVKFDKGSYNLKSGESVSVDYTISVPKDARSGGHYVVLFAETQPSGEENVARKKRVGSLVYAKVAGEYNTSGKFEGISSDTWFNGGPVTTEIRMVNEGNVDYDASTQVTYTSLFGKVVHEDKQTRVVMPGTMRKITTTWENPPLFGIYKQSGNVSYLGKTDELPSKYVVVLPYWLLITIVAVIIALVVLKMIKKRNKKNKK